MCLQVWQSFRPFVHLCKQVKQEGLLFSDTKEKINKIKRQENLAMLRINKHCLDVMVLTLLGGGVVAEQLTGLKPCRCVVSLDKKIYSTKGGRYRCLKIEFLILTLNYLSSHYRSLCAGWWQKTRQRKSCVWHATRLYIGPSVHSRLIKLLMSSCWF